MKLDDGARPSDAMVRGCAVGSAGRIAYYGCGTGSPLLLLNGGPGFPAQHFEPLARQLSETFALHVIRFDQRGTGKSDSDSDFSLPAMVDDIEALRRELGYPSWTVLGHSFGATLGLAYSSAYPTRVRRLVLSAAPGLDLTYIPRLGANIQARLSEAERAQLATNSMAEDPTYDIRLASLSIVLSTYISDRSQLEQLRTSVVDSRVFVPEVNARVMQSLADSQHDLRSGMKSLSMPVTIIHGADDPLGEESPREILEAIPGARLHLIPNASHYIWLDSPAHYYEAVKIGITEAPVD